MDKKIIVALLVVILILGVLNMSKTGTVDDLEEKIAELERGAKSTERTVAQLEQKAAEVDVKTSKCGKPIQATIGHNWTKFRGRNGCGYRYFMMNGESGTEGEMKSSYGHTGKLVWGQDAPSLKGNPKYIEVRLVKGKEFDFMMEYFPLGNTTYQ